MSARARIGLHQPAAMVDVYCNVWDLAATRVLIPEAGGRCETLDHGDGKAGLIFGNPTLVETLLEFWDVADLQR